MDAAARIYCFCAAGSEAQELLRTTDTLLISVLMFHFVLDDYSICSDYRLGSLNCAGNCSMA